MYYYYYYCKPRFQVYTHLSVQTQSKLAAHELVKVSIVFHIN